MFDAGVSVTEPEVCEVVVIVLPLSVVIETVVAFEACQLIVSRHRRKEDDATVLVADIDV